MLFYTEGKHAVPMILLKRKLTPLLGKCASIYTVWGLGAKKLVNPCK